MDRLVEVDGARSGARSARLVDECRYRPRIPVRAVDQAGRVFESPIAPAKGATASVPRDSNTLGAREGAPAKRASDSKGMVHP
jgi:hypothetical protein